MTPSMHRVLSVGASRGIGLEFVRPYRAAGAAVTATARSDQARACIAALGAQALRLDVAHAAGAAVLAWPIDGERFDVVVLDAGVYGPADLDGATSVADMRRTLAALTPADNGSSQSRRPGMGLVVTSPP